MLRSFKQLAPRLPAGPSLSGSLARTAVAPRPSPFDSSYCRRLLSSTKPPSPPSPSSPRPSTSPRPSALPRPASRPRQASGPPPTLSDLLESRPMKLRGAVVHLENILSGLPHPPSPDNWKTHPFVHFDSASNPHISYKVIPAIKGYGKVKNMQGIGTMLSLAVDLEKSFNEPTPRPSIPDNMLPPGTTSLLRVVNTAIAAHGLNRDAPGALKLYTAIKSLSDPAAPPSAGVHVYNSSGASFTLPATFKPDLVTYNTTMSALERGGDVESATKVLSDFKAAVAAGRVNPPDAFSYTVQLNILKHGGDVTSAARTLDEMLSANGGSYAKTPAIFNAFDAAIRCVASRKALNLRPAPDFASVRALLDRCEALRKMAPVLNNSSTALQWSHPSFVYVAALHAAVTFKHFDLIRPLLDEAIATETGLQPSMMPYAAAIAAFWTQSKTLMDHRDSKKCLDEIQLSLDQALQRDAEKRGRDDERDRVVNKAIEAVSAIISAECRLAYTLPLDAPEPRADGANSEREAGETAAYFDVDFRAERSSRILNLLKSAEALGVVCSSQAFREAIEALGLLGKGKDSYLLTKLYAKQDLSRRSENKDSFQSSSYTVNELVWNTAITACRNWDWDGNTLVRWDVAKDIVENEMWKSSKISPSVVSYSALLHCLCAAGRGLEAHGVIMTMISGSIAGRSPAPSYPCFLGAAWAVANANLNSKQQVPLSKLARELFVESMFRLKDDELLPIVTATMLSMQKHSLDDEGFSQELEWLLTTIASANTTKNSEFLYITCLRSCRSLRRSSALPAALKIIQRAKADGVVPSLPLYRGAAGGVAAAWVGSSGGIAEFPPITPMRDLYKAAIEDGVVKLWDKEEEFGRGLVELHNLSIPLAIGAVQVALDAAASDNSIVDLSFITGSERGGAGTGIKSNIEAVWEAAGMGGEFQTKDAGNSGRLHLVGKMSIQMSKKALDDLRKKEVEGQASNN